MQPSSLSPSLQLAYSTQPSGRYPYLPAAPNVDSPIAVLFDFCTTFACRDAYGRTTRTNSSDGRGLTCRLFERVLTIHVRRGQATTAPPPKKKVHSQVLKCWQHRRSTASSPTKAMSREFKTQSYDEDDSNDTHAPFRRSFILKTGRLTDWFNGRRSD